MVPLVEDRVSVPVVERLVLAAWEMVPVPFAFKVIDEPVTLAFMAIPALVPDWRMTAPEALMVSPLATVMLPPLAVSVMENMAPLKVPVVEKAAESVKYTLPDVLIIGLPAFVRIFAPEAPMLPLLENRVNVPAVIDWCRRTG